MKKFNYLFAFYALCAGEFAHAADLLNLHNPAHFEQKPSAWVEVAAVGGSTFRSLQNAVHDQWDNLQPRNGQNLEFAINRASVGFSQSGWTIGISNRQELLGEAQKDTLDVYQSQILGTPVPSPRPYSIDYRLQGLERQGISLGKAFLDTYGGHQLRLGVNATLLNAKRVKAQSAWGQANASSGGPLVVTGATYNDDSATDIIESGFIPKFHNQTPSGGGYALDFGLHYLHPSGAELEWTIADAVSAIEWKNVPEITLSGSSVFNGQFPGGRKVLIDLTQTLIPKHAITARFPMGSYSVEVTQNVIGPVSIFNAGLKHKFAGDWVVGCDYDFFFNALGVNLSNSIFGMSLRTDSLNLEQAHSILLRISARAMF